MGPSFIAGAFFVGIILNDLIQTTATKEVLKHTLFGLVSIASLWVLEVSNRTTVAWGLFLIPTVVFLSSLIYVFVNENSKPMETPFLPLPLPPKPAAPEPEPVVNLPEENTVCVELTFDPTQPAPHNPYESSCEVSESTGEIGLPGTLKKPVEASSKGAAKDTSKTTGSAAISSAAISSAAISSAATGSESEAPPTSQEILGELNRRLTPYTVCEK